MRHELARARRPGHIVIATKPRRNLKKMGRKMKKQNFQKFQRRSACLALLCSNHCLARTANIAWL